MCVFEGENVHISKLQCSETSNVTASPVLREYNTQPQIHTSVRKYTSERNDMIEVKSPCYRRAAEDTGCGNERIEFLSPELEAGHEPATHEHHTQTHTRHLISAKHHGSISWIICRVGNPTMQCGELKKKLMMVDEERDDRTLYYYYTIYIVTYKCMHVSIYL